MHKSSNDKQIQVATFVTAIAVPFNYGQSLFTIAIMQIYKSTYIAIDTIKLVD